MSLVNDMLNDLDSRRNKQASGNVDLEWMAGNTPVQRRQRYMPLIALVFIMLLIAVSLAIWENLSTDSSGGADRLLGSPSPQSDIVGSKVSAENSEAATAVTTSQNNPAPINITTATIAEKPVSTSPNIPKKTVSGIDKVKISTEVESQEQLNKTNVVTETVSTSQPGADQKTGSKEIGPMNTRPLELDDNQSVEAEKVRIARPLTAKKIDLMNARKARELIANNSIDQAEELLNSFVLQQPLAFVSGELLAGLWISQKKYSMAEGLLNNLLENGPENIGLIEVNSRLLLLTERPDLAVDMLLKQRPAIYANHSYYELLALAARQNKQYMLSGQVYNRLLTVEPEQGNWWVGMAIAFDAQANEEKARVAYIRALRTSRISVNLADYARKRLAAMSKE